ncbi:MAG: RDD family protein [Solirubrobacteraceae bacterium]|nr:RDD family protein [Solirubrobacteraceae bacterium]
MTDATIRAAQRAAGVAVTGVADPLAPPPLRYVGLVTRVVAMVIDAAILNIVAVITGVSVSLVLGIFNLPEQTTKVVAAIGGTVFALWVVVYFVGFWCINAQTLGDRVMGFRVQQSDGRRLKPRRAVVRFGGMVLCMIPLGAGFLPILFDDRRRGLHDRLARSVVLEGSGDRPHEPPHGPDLTVLEHE